MSRRIILSLFLAAFGCLAAAALIPLERIERHHPDLDRIKKEVYDRKSPYYYPRLMNEFQRNDTTMNLEKYRYLYLGYMFQEDYNPYRAPAFSGRILTNYAKSELTSQECDSVIKYSDLALLDNPFDLNQMSALIAALRQKGQTNLANIWEYKFNHILMAIVSTGTGADEENAWYVIEPQHEYVLLNTIGYTVTNHLFYEPYYEYLTVKDPAEKDAGGFYFNIHRILKEYYRKFPDEIEPD